jgi:hypothetical protein
MYNEINLLKFFSLYTVTQLSNQNEKYIPFDNVERWQNTIEFDLLKLKDLQYLENGDKIKIKFGINEELGYEVGGNFTFINKNNLLYYFENNYIISEHELYQMILDSNVYINNSNID